MYLVLISTCYHSHKVMNHYIGKTIHLNNSFKNIVTIITITPITKIVQKIFNNSLYSYKSQWISALAGYTFTPTNFTSLYSLCRSQRACQLTTNCNATEDTAAAMSLCEWMHMVKKKLRQENVFWKNRQNVLRTVLCRTVMMPRRSNKRGGVLCGRLQHFNRHIW